MEIVSETPGGKGKQAEVVRSVRVAADIPPEKGQMPLRAVVRASKEKEGTWTCAAVLPGDRILLIHASREETLGGETSEKTVRTMLSCPASAGLGPIALDRAGTTLYAGTSDGALLWWKLDEDGNVAKQEVMPAFHDKRAITSLGLLLGDVSLAVGDAQGQLTTWFFVHTGASSASVQKLRLIHTLESHAAAVREIIPSSRNKTLLSFDADGVVAMDHMTSERHLATIREQPSLAQAAMSFRADAAAGMDADGGLTAWRILCPHPEVSWQTLFGRVQYEGYDEPVYAWQSTGGEDYEPKMSLVPLFFGTLKATFYAMLLAMPLSLGAAAYVSHFASPGFKQWIKPTVEIMAAMPSVVIGFIAALWLAPILQIHLTSLFLLLMTLPATLLAFLLLWQAAQNSDWVQRTVHGREFLVLVPVLILGFLFAVWLAPLVENRLLGGKLMKDWLESGLHVHYDQRNSVIIAIGLGFAVIPIIFSLAEDALSNVPYNMTAASMALGASRWQTLWRVVLPSASPGIFAAVMIGFGRAVGETMIVLMATGNTPLIDWNPFNGMRTLSANIAVEIPEAPVPDIGVPGTLYRILFLCAVLLFVMTFFLNTAAELVRQRLRKRYGQY